MRKFAIVAGHKLPHGGASAIRLSRSCVRRHQARVIEPLEVTRPLEHSDGEVSPATRIQGKPAGGHFIPQMRANSCPWSKDGLMRLVRTSELESTQGVRVPKNMTLFRGFSKAGAVNILRRTKV